MAKRELSDFEQAFAAARKQGAGTEFTYKGEKKRAYYKGEEPESWKKSSAPAAKPEAPRGVGAARGSFGYDTAAMRSNREAMESGAKGSTKKGDTPAAVTRQREQDAKTAAGLTAATMGPIAAGGTGLATTAVRPLAAALRTRMPTPKAMAEEALREPMRKALRRQPGGYAKGGVAKYAKGGSVRGGGIERKGKTKGRFV